MRVVVIAVHWGTGIVGWRGKGLGTLTYCSISPKRRILGFEDMFARTITAKETGLGGSG